MDILLRQEGINKVENYAKMLGLSKRTVYSYLNDVEAELLKMGYMIEKNPGLGIKVKYVGLKESFDFETNDYSAKVRRIELVRRLFIERKRINIYDFCDEYYISQNTLRYDIQYLNKTFEKNYPMKIHISSQQVKFQDDLSQKIICQNQIYFNEQLMVGQNYQEKIRQLEVLYPITIIECIDKIIQNYIRDVNLNLAEHYMINIFSVLITLLSQAKHQHHIEDNQSKLIIDKVKFLPNLILAKQFLECLEQYENVHFEEGDTKFLSEYLLADRIWINNFDNILPSDQLVYDRILKRMQVLLDVDFSCDMDHFNHLILHLNAMVFRLRKGICIKNELIESIKHEFDTLFNLCWIVFENEEKALGINLTEDEVGFLLVHFQYFIDQQKQTKNILLICPHGVITSELVLNRLHKILPPFNSIETASLQKAKQSDLSSIDFIVTTVRIDEQFDKPVIYVSPIMSNDDLKNIMVFYQNLVLNKTFDLFESHYDYLKHYIDTSLILEMDVKNKEEAIHQMSELLYKKGYVEKNYELSLNYREKMGSTDNIYGVALPHGQMQSVKKTIVSFIILPDYRKWKKHMVKVIVFLNLSKDDLSISRNILNDIFCLIKSDRFQSMLKNGISKEKFITLLGVDKE